MARNRLTEKQRELAREYMNSLIDAGLINKTGFRLEFEYSKAELQDKIDKYLERNKLKNVDETSIFSSLAKESVSNLNQMEMKFQPARHYLPLYGCINTAQWMYNIERSRFSKSSRTQSHVRIAFTNMQLPVAYYLPQPRQSDIANNFNRNYTDTYEDGFNDHQRVPVLRGVFGNIAAVRLSQHPSAHKVPTATPVAQPSPPASSNPSYAHYEEEFIKELIREKQPEPAKQSPNRKMYGKQKKVKSSTVVKRKYKSNSDQRERNKIKLRDTNTWMFHYSSVSNLYGPKREYKSEKEYRDRSNPLLNEYGDMPAYGMMFSSDGIDEIQFSKDKYTTEHEREPLPGSGDVVPTKGRKAIVFYIKGEKVFCKHRRYAKPIPRHLYRYDVMSAILEGFQPGFNHGDIITDYFDVGGGPL